MTALDTRDEGPAQLTLLPPSLVVARVRRPDGDEDEARTEAPGEPLDQPLREQQIRVLYVVHGLHVRGVRAVTTRMVRQALCLPDTSTATRNVERMLGTLLRKRVIAEAETLRKGAGRPARIWRVTPVGVAELRAEHLASLAEAHNRAAEAKRRNKRRPKGER